MALQAIPNYDIGSVDVGKSFEQGMLFRQQIEQRQAAQQAQEAAQAEAEAIKVDIGRISANPTVANITDLITKYPQLAERFKSKLAQLTTQERDAKQALAVPVYAAMQNGKPEVAISLMQQQVDALRNSGDEQGAKAGEAQIALIKASPEAATTAFGVTLAGIMGPDNFKNTFASIGEQMKLPSELAKLKREATDAATGAGIEVHSVKIYPNGVTRIVGKDGQQRVTNARGDVVTGAAADAALQSGLDADVRLAGGKAGAAAEATAGVEARTRPGIEATTQAAKDAVAIGTEAYKKIAPLRQSVSNLKEARRLVADGANTGVIVSKFPSLFASAVELDNLQKTLGLDILSTGSFGVASESDVRLAMQTAIPTGLEGDKLVAWFDRKIAAQNRVIANLERVAKFMQKGRTVADFLEANGIDQGTAAPKPAAGGATVTHSVDY